MVRYYDDVRNCTKYVSKLALVSILAYNAFIHY